MRACVHAWCAWVYGVRVWRGVAWYGVRACLGGCVCDNGIAGSFVCGALVGWLITSMYSEKSWRMALLCLVHLRPATGVAATRYGVMASQAAAELVAEHIAGALPHFFVVGVRCASVNPV